MGEMTKLKQYAFRCQNIKIILGFYLVIIFSPQISAQLTFDVYSNIYYETDKFDSISKKENWEISKKNKSYFIGFPYIVTDKVIDSLCIYSNNACLNTVMNILPLKGHLILKDYNFRNIISNYKKNIWHFIFNFDNELSSYPFKVSKANKISIFFIECSFYYSDCEIPLRILTRIS